MKRLVIGVLDDALRFQLMLCRRAVSVSTKVMLWCSRFFFALLSLSLSAPSTRNFVMCKYIEHFCSNELPRAVAYNVSGGQQGYVRDVVIPNGVRWIGEADSASIQSPVGSRTQPHAACRRLVASTLGWKSALSHAWARHLYPSQPHSPTSDRCMRKQLLEVGHEHRRPSPLWDSRLLLFLVE